MKKDIYRILDANANRAREGLRVLEDITRFIFNDKRLTGQFKKERHRITLLLANIPAGAGEKFLLRYRNSVSDVGSKSDIMAEGQRADIKEIAVSNFRRSQEAIRVLEEFTKLFSTTIPGRFKAMRFRLYTLEQQFSCKVETVN